MALKDLTAEQRELAEFMSHLSERSYRAGWMSGIERALWVAMQGPPGGEAPIWLSADEAMELRRLSSQCGGWIEFDEMLEEMFVPLAEWEARLAASPRGAS